MRKYIHVTAVLFVLINLTVTSCKKDFLEIIPKGSLVAKSFDDYNLLLNNPNFYIFNKLGIWQAAMIMGDDVSAEESLFSPANMAQARSLFQYDDDIFIPSPSSANSENPLFLINLLQNLYVINKVINEVNASSGGSVQQKLQVQAEAKATRAFTNFQLINYFAQPYSAVSAPTDPGFPIITTADITVTGFKRGTVQGMYDFILSDLTAALPYLATQPSFPTRWSKPAAEGFLGKVYLFMGKNEEALAMFNASFADMDKMGQPLYLYDYNETLAPGGAFMPIDPDNGPNSPFNNIADMTESLIATFSYSANRDGSNFGNDFLTIDPNARALFDPTDLRLKLFTEKMQNGENIPGQRMRRYTPFYSSYVRIGLELPELYLLRAEAKARTNDLSGAKEDVEALRKKRMPLASAEVPSAIANNQIALTKFILDERIREFAGLGYRWWDMRRLSVDPVFSISSLPSHTLYLTNGGTTEFPLMKERLTLRLPSLYLAGHPDDENNP